MGRVVFWEFGIGFTTLGVHLGAGVNGVVTSIALANTQIQVAGNFTTETRSASGLSAGVGGFANWEIKSGSWVPVNSGGFVMGNLTFVGNGESQFLAGNVQTMAEYGAIGLVILSNLNGDNNGPMVTPLGNQLDTTANTILIFVIVGHNVGPIMHYMAMCTDSCSTYGSTNAEWFKISELGVEDDDTTCYLSHLKIHTLFARQSTTSASTPPPPPPATAPTVLTGVFWSNSSSSHEVAIIGGNFSFPTSSSAVSQAVAIYDPVTSSVTALAGAQVYGVVRALYVGTESHLYVGGEFNLSDTNGNGFAIYDLTTQQRLTTVAQPLQATSGSYIAVRSITTSTYKPNTVIVAGSFAQGSTVVCQGICLFDTVLNQWSALGSDMRGDITSVSYAGLRQYHLDCHWGPNSDPWTRHRRGSQQWQFIKHFCCWTGFFLLLISPSSTADGSSPFMVFWDGVSWSNVAASGSGLQGNSNISQLLMVPLQNTHSSNSVIESDRMLMISGALSDSSFGSASSVLFDGQTFVPYIVSMSGQATMGYVLSLFYSITNFSFSQQHFLATGIIILISIAIAVGVIFLLTLIGIVWTLLSRRDDKFARYEKNDEDDDSIQHRPSSLLEHINAATRTTILGTQSPFNNFSAEKGAAREAEMPSDAVVGSMAVEEEVSRPAHARYSFDGTGEGELLLTAGVEIEVLDNRDNALKALYTPLTTTKFCGDNVLAPVAPEMSARWVSSIMITQTDAHYPDSEEHGMLNPSRLSRDGVGHAEFQDQGKQQESRDFPPPRQSFQVHCTLNIIVAPYCFLMLNIYPSQGTDHDFSKIISGSEVSTTQSTPSPMSYQRYPSTASITSPPPTSSPPENCVLRSSSPTYLEMPLGLKRRRTTSSPIKKRISVSNIISDFTNLKEGYLECSEMPSKYSDRGSIFDNLSSDSDGPDTEYIGARLVLEAAHAQRNVRHAEKVLSKYLSKEHIALGRVYQFQEAKANRRLVNAECIIGAVCNSMHTNGIPFNTQVPILPYKRRRSSVDSNSAADVPLTLENRPKPH
ncbi:cortical protein marker for cell polarity-domain-containing protein [Melanogaster broomeanus]|nr:cortical protein marker for cell polarity-domain-containing protein [Melanogaster broomeanus]